MVMAATVRPGRPGPGSEPAASARDDRRRSGKQVIALNLLASNNGVGTGTVPAATLTAAEAELAAWATAL
jgi:hypothetical protein